MQSVISKRFRGWRPLGLITALVASLALPMIAGAQMWSVQVGAQSQDKGSQGLAFLPNEIWIHAGDTITWTIASDEPHIVAFLAPGQVRPPFAVGCPGTTPDGSDENGSNCMNSGMLANGQSYSVTFPKAGNYKLVCLIHTNMTAVVHVLDPSQELPHNQNFYDAEAADERNELLSAAGHTRDQDAQDEIGLPQLPLSFTRFRVTFTKPGLFDYKCALHDGLEMVGLQHNMYFASYDLQE